MGKRSDKLAARIEAGAEALASLAEDLSAAEWFIMWPVPMWLKSI